MTDLLKLAERIEAGSFDTRSYLWDFTDKEGYALAVKAFNGSLDAAKALHDAVLPGAEWIIGTSDDGLWFAKVLVNGSAATRTVYTFSEASTSAKAWLSGILKAKTSVKRTVRKADD